MSSFRHPPPVSLYMKREVLAFVLSVLVGFVVSFVGAHLLADLLYPPVGPTFEGVLLLVR